MSKVWKLFPVIAGITLAFGVQGQQTVISRSDVTTGNWNDAQRPWLYQAGGTTEERPDVGAPSIRNDVFINHNANPAMSINATFTLRNVTIQAGTTIIRTYEATSGNRLNLNGGIFNESASTQTFITPVFLEGPLVKFQANGSGTLSLQGNIDLNGNTAEFGGGSIVVMRGAITGTGGISKTGSGLLQLTANNTYIGNTTISEGNLRLGASNRIPDNSTIVFNGGKLLAGMTRGYNEVAGPILLNANSYLVLGTTADPHSLAFASSSHLAWTGNQLRILNWKGINNGNSSGTIGKIFVGNNTTGLTADQLSKIHFEIDGIWYTAAQLADGEIVPTSNRVAYYWGGSNPNSISEPYWGFSASGPFNNVWKNDQPVIFNNPNSTIAAGYVLTPSITAIENVTFSGNAGPIGSNEQILNLMVAGNKTLNFGTQGFANQPTFGIIKNGPGTIALFGNPYGAGFVLNEGTAIANGDYAFGGSATNFLTINNGTIASGFADITFANKFNNGIFVNNNFTLGSVVAPALASASMRFTDPVYLGNNTNRIITLGGTGTYSFESSFNGTNSSLTIGANNPTASMVMGAISGPASTYTGPTTINNTTLLINSTNQTSGVLVNNGARLGGAGSVAGPVTLSGATIAPGASLTTTGTFTTGGLTFNDGSKFAFHIQNVNGIPGVDWDLIASNGIINCNASIGNPVTISLGSLPVSGWGNGCNSFSWVIATGSSVTGFNPAEFIVNTTGVTVNIGGTFTVEQNVNSLVLKYTPTVLTGTNPGTISGNNSVIIGQNYIYTLPPVSGASSYIWTVPAGWSILSGENSNQITVLAGFNGGNITVKSNNICTQSLTSSFSIGTPLPVNLFSFQGRRTSNGNSIAWITSSEQNTDRFELERGMNGQSFGTISTISATGYSNSQKTYSYLDGKPQNGKNYYRLKMMDKDGSFRYSQIVVIDNTDGSPLTIVLPNPTLKGTNAQFGISGIGEKTVLITVSNAAGQIFESFKIRSSANGEVKSPIQTSKMAAGVYYINCRTASGEILSTIRWMIID